MIVEQDEAIEADLAANLENRAILINESGIPIEDIDRGVVSKSLEDMFKATWPITVVSVEPANDVSRGLSESPIEGFALTSVGPGSPADV